MTAGGFPLKAPQEYSDFCEKTIRNAIDRDQLKSCRVKIKGQREGDRIKREWIDAWIEGMPVPTIEEIIAGTCWNDGPDPITALSEQIAQQVATLLKG